MRYVRLLGLIVISLGSTAAILYWSFWMKGAVEGAGQRERTVRVEAAIELLDAQTVHTAWAARQVASVAAADPRPRASLSIAPFDEATLQDAVDDVRQDTGVDWLGLSSSFGRVLVGAGPQALKAMVGIDLKDSALFQQAVEKKAQSTLWFTAGGPMVVTAAPVMKGATRVGVVLVGRMLEQASFERAASLAGGPVGLLGPYGEWAGTTSAPLDDADVLRSPSSVWPGVSLVLSVPLTPSPDGLWLPLVIVAVMGVAALLLLSSMRVPLAKN